MWIAYDTNEYGTKISRHVCDTCGEPFTLCPAQEPTAPGWENCMMPWCDSYDPERDVDRLFADNPDLTLERRPPPELN